MNKYDLFLQQSKFESKIINESTLEKVSIYEKKNRWVFHVILQEVISINHLEPFISNVKRYFHLDPIVSDIIVRIEFQDLTKLKQYSQEYWLYVMKLICERHPSYLILKNYEVKFDNNTYTLTVDKESNRIIKPYLKRFKDVFSSLGFTVSIIIIVCNEKETIEDEIELKEREVTELIANRPYEPAIIEKKLKPSRMVGPVDVKISEIPMDQRSLDEYENRTGPLNFIIVGSVIKHEVRQFNNKSESILLTMTVADKNDAIVVKKWLNKGKEFDNASELEIGDIIKVRGPAKLDTYLQEIIIGPTNTSYQFLRKDEPESRHDNATKKRIEFHVHTKMSNMDAITDAKDYVKAALDWGHEAIAFTDHDGLYAFPEIHNATKGKPIKPIYGVELDFVDESSFQITNVGKDTPLKELTYVVFDIETTGLSSTRDKIIEIGAVKINEGHIVDRYQSYVNPEEKLKDFTTQLTGITDEDVGSARLISEVLPEFLRFSEFLDGKTDVVFVAHNALFDIGHIVENSKRLNIPFDEYRMIDTLNLARYFYSEDLKRFNLKALARFFKVKLEAHHRADQDAEATAEVWLKMCQNLIEKNIVNYHDINNAIDINEGYKHIRPHHINVLAQNQEGYKNLFKVVSQSLTKNFYKGPRTLKSNILNHRKGLLIGSGCSNGDVFEAALHKGDEDLKKAIAFYDYIEVQPLEGYLHIIDNLGTDGVLQIQEIIKKIINFSKAQDKIVIASGDVHYLDKEDKMYRDIYIRAPLVGGGIHQLRSAMVKPTQHFMTTDEMLEAFAFLGEIEAFEIVVNNTHKLNKLIEPVEAFSSKLHSLPDDAFNDVLGVKSISQEVKELVMNSARARYGKVLPEIISNRIDFELKSIIGNDFAPIYYISHLLVKKSLEDGYLVGSRGSVGSSFVATLMDITEVNPLAPHYYCPNSDYTLIKLTQEQLKNIQFSKEDENIYQNFTGAQSGFDLPDAFCPKCKAKLIKDGHDIPFETFLGFDGDKVPDIDLNFSGDYQAKAHQYVRDLLGKDKTFRAGTIQTVAERNAYGYVKGYVEDENIIMRSAQVERLAQKIQGVKRSTGQHPGGIVVVPASKEIYDVTPIQYPANDTNSEWFTTHFDYHSFEDNLLKLDILGHDDPTLIKFLMDYVLEHPTEFPFSNAKDIPLDDKEVYRLFSGTEVINVSSRDIDSQVASFGIPEFGTPFTRQMLSDTKPSSFAGLVKISGLSHGTDVWLKNSQDLVKGDSEYGQIPFDDIIACRDDIMVQLMSFGIKPLEAFNIMEFVRRGRPSKDKKTWKKYEKIMLEHQVPDWYIWSASQIKYMFPKAHATAYVIMAMRIAWFKVHKPLLFYSGFFSKRAVQFDHEAMVGGTNGIRNKITSYGSNTYGLKNKDENLLVTLGVAQEMTYRNFKFLPVDINKSDALDFKMEDKGLRMPFVSIDGLGNAVALDIIEQRTEKPFSSKDDVKNRTRINKTVFEKMFVYGSFDELPDEDEILEQGIFAI